MEEYIRTKRPKLSPNSVKTYASNLRTLFKDIQYEGSLDDLMSEKSCQVINYIGTLSDNRIKQAASAVLITCPENMELKTLILEANQRCCEEDQKQELTSAQKLAWLPWSEIINIRNKLEEECRPLWIKLELSHAEYFKLQNSVIAMVFTLIPPRRCLDFCYMKLEDQQDGSNCIISRDSKQYFVFNRYKTSKTYGMQEIEIPDALWEVLREWKKVSVSPWLFHMSPSNPAPLRSDQFSRRIAQVFKQKGFGVNLLRHAYVSDELLTEMPFIEELKNSAYKLGHSMKETILYKKHHSPN